MKTDKEYPATHSMSTAWYCVDEDGNVGIFDIDDNGPVPVGGYEENTVDDIFWEDFSHEGKPYKILHLKPEQIPQMLESSDIKDVWMEDEIGESRSNVSWMNVIIQIDMNKLEVLLEAFSMDDGPCHSLICLSEKMGLFFVDFFSNKKGLELLKKNSVIKAKYRTLEYDYTDEDDSEELMRIHKENQRFPVYIYRQNYWPFHDPAIRVTNPESPLRIEQLPEDVRKKIKKIPVKFKEWEKIQLAEFLPVDILSIEYVYNGQIWCELASSDDSQIYYNVKTKAIINKETMDKLIAEGKAEEFDWDKHRSLKKW